MIDPSPFREPEDWEVEEFFGQQCCLTCAHWTEKSYDQYGIAHGICAVFKDKPGYGDLWAEHDGEDCGEWELEEAVKSPSPDLQRDVPGLARMDTGKLTGKLVGRRSRNE